MQTLKKKKINIEHQQNNHLFVHVQYETCEQINTSIYIGKCHSTERRHQNNNNTHCIWIIEYGKFILQII
jgi:hypothetical protein